MRRQPNEPALLDERLADARRLLAAGRRDLATSCLALELATNKAGGAQEALELDLARLRCVSAENSALSSLSSLRQTSHEVRDAQVCVQTDSLGNLRLDWWTSGSLGAVLCLVFLVFPTVAFGVALVVLAAPFSWLCLWLGVTYLELAATLDRTTLELSNGDLSVRHGPLPLFHKSRTIRAARTAALETEVVETEGGNESRDLLLIDGEHFHSFGLGTRNGRIAAIVLSALRAALELNRSSAAANPPSPARRAPR